MKKEIEVEISVQDAIETLREAVYSENDVLKRNELYKNIAHHIGLTEVCNILPVLWACKTTDMRGYLDEFRRMLPISVEEAIRVIEGTTEIRHCLSEDQQKHLLITLRDNPQALAILASRTWEDSDILTFLKDRFGNKGYTAKTDLIRNIAEYIQNS